MKEKIKIGIIGAGARGKFIAGSIFLEMDDVEIIAIAEPIEERLLELKVKIEEKYNKKIIATADYNEVISIEALDAIVILGAWHCHTDIAVSAMKAGKYVAMEVGGAYDISDCYKLVETSEETKMPCMMLENCCYGRNELMVLNMVKQGLFGEIVHCAGGYLHDLRTSDLTGDANVYRQLEYIKRNCHNYPTHDLGPISKVLGINRGNRMMKLSSMATKAAGLKDYFVRTYGAEDERSKTRYSQGDIITTAITCAGSETIVLTLDTTLPRAYYSRNFTVRGTRAMFEESRQVLFLDGDTEEVKFNLDDYRDKYDHPLHAEYAKLGEKSGHGGMDWLVCRAFVESVKKGTNTPIDVYDTAAWMSITPLSEQSISLGGMPVPVPDFTRGKWERREPVIEGKYCLDKVCEDTSTKIY